jgi:hypothetical protein
VKDVVHRTHTVERRFRAVPIGSRATFIDLPIPRVECRDCGVVRDELDHRHDRGRDRRGRDAAPGRRRRAHLSPGRYGASMRANGLSMMPEELEVGLDPQGMANLSTY